jgi:hypothetical protein
MAALTWPPASFDAVIAFYSIIHLPRDEQLGLFRKIFGWLNPVGPIRGDNGHDRCI